MCKICVEFQLGKMTRREAMRNLFESSMPEHVEEALSVLRQEEDQDCPDTDRMD